MTTDQVAAGVHVPADAAPGVMARKLLRRSLSDLAAAGAAPWAATWNVAAPKKTPLDWLRRLARAFLAEAERFGCPVVGGDLSAAPGLVLSCQLLGRESRRRAPGRSGARPGHRICVTGRLGGAVSSGRHLRPEPRLTEGRLLVERYRATAMIDLSDGLARDLPRILRASSVGAVVDLESLPLSRGLQHQKSGWEAAVGEGEDYELLAVLRPDAARHAARDAVLRRTGFRVIGAIEEGQGVEWRADGKAMALRAKGWEHRWS